MKNLLKLRATLQKQSRNLLPMMATRMQDQSQQVNFTKLVGAGTVTGTLAYQLWKQKSLSLPNLLDREPAMCAAPEDPFERSKRSEPINNKENFLLVAGSSHQDLAKRVASHLGMAQPDECKLHLFADGERLAHFPDNSKVKGKHVHILQSTSKPVNEHTMELFLMVSAAKRAGAATVTVVIPYYGYARQDRRPYNWGMSLSSCDIGQMLEFLGVNRIITLDLHAPQVTGSTTAKCCWEDHQAAFVAVDYFMKELGNRDDVCVVAPDAGAAKRAKDFQQILVQRGMDAGLALMHKERMKANEVATATVIGDVTGKTCIIIDDMTDTAGTLCKASTELKEKGAKEVYAFVTHGIFSGPAAERVAASDLTKIVATDSMVTKDKAEIEQRMKGKLVHVSVDLLLAELIRRNHQNEDTLDISKGCSTYKN